MPVARSARQCKHGGHHPMSGGRNRLPIVLPARVACLGGFWSTEFWATSCPDSVGKASTRITGDHLVWLAWALQAAKCPRQFNKPSPTTSPGFCKIANGF